MKFRCQQADLSHALDVVSYVIDANVTLPVLNNILMKAEGDRVYFSATNLEMAVNFWMQAEVMMEGAVTVPAKLLSGYINLLKDDQLECALGDGLTLAIKSAGSKTQIKCIAAEEYPSISAIEELVQVELPLAVVPEAINQVNFASSATNTRPILAGMYCDVKKNMLTLVATDSFRLSEKKIALELPVETEAHCIIPTRAVAELARLCGKVAEVEKVIMSLGKNQVMFKIGDIELYSRLIEGNFPNYQMILPEAVQTSTTLYTSDLARASKRITLFAKENNSKVLFDFKKNSLDLSTPATQVGTEEGELPISLDGEPAQIALNSEYVLDLLSHVGAEQVDIGMNDSTSPAVFRPVGKDDFIHIIMPLKLQ